MDHQLLLDLVSRRHWLLTKALEFVPLGEALVLAQAAEDFIAGTAAGIDDRSSSGVMQASTFGAGSKAEDTQLKLLTALPVGSNQPPSKCDQPLKTTEALAGLNSFATIDDVILYLRQRGEVFPENESADGLLVRANLKRMEQGLPPFALLPTPATEAIRREKPEKVTLPRVSSKRERDEWARRVVVLLEE